MNRSTKLALGAVVTALTIGGTVAASAQPDQPHRAAVRAVPTAELDVVGLAVYGPRNGVDKVVKGARMHP